MDEELGLKKGDVLEVLGAFPLPGGDGSGVGLYLAGGDPVRLYCVDGYSEQTLTCQEVAELEGVSVASARNWCADGRINGAFLAKGPTGRPAWRVPVGAYRLFERPRVGRPRNKKGEKER